MAFQDIRAEIEAGIALPKCQKCGCMAYVLRHLADALPQLDGPMAHDLQAVVKAALARMQPVAYDCFGCAHCYPAVAYQAWVEREGHQM
ncbi:MAG: hypothetical protein Q6K95_06630 [Gloeomargarita sp. GXS_bins_116]